MTLRVTLEIIPFGDEAGKREIEEINISNIGGIGFGLCEYVIERNSYKSYTDETPRVEHSRQDGALVLVRKALERIT